ncbi:MAG: hypothetical protein HWD60_09540 [Defluviicoccus sp.]|nr:MAG: hypothetical protein HWD60_09540 [Defluviicoccus sp.]
MLTIVTPAQHRRLTTPAAVREALGITDEDAELLPAIERASAAIEAWCGRVFAREVVRETWLPTRAQWSLQLSRWPVFDVVEVIEDGRTVASANYELDAATGILRRLWCGHHASWMACRIEVEYAAGYVLPGDDGRDLPADIEDACVRTVAAAREGIKRDPAVRRIGVGDGGKIDVTFDTSAGALPPAAVALLQHYRCPALA